MRRRCLVDAGVRTQGRCEVSGLLLFAWGWALASLLFGGGDSRSLDSKWGRGAIFALALMVIDLVRAGLFR